MYSNDEGETAMTHEEMLEEAERREKENQVLEIAKKCIEEYSGAMKELAKIEHQELATELALELRSWAQNEEMIDQYFTAHGRICNQAADLLELLANETVD
jgi:hypothetical protein